MEVVSLIFQQGRLLNGDYTLAQYSEVLFVFDLEKAVMETSTFVHNVLCVKQHVAQLLKYHCALLCNNFLHVSACEHDSDDLNEEDGAVIPWCDM